MPGGRPPKPPAPPPRRKPGAWSVSFVPSRNRWRVRPPPSVDPARHETFHETEQAALDYVAQQRARLAEPAQAVIWTLGEWSGQWLADTATASGWSVRTREIYADHLWYFSTLHDLELTAILPSLIRSRVATLLTVGAERRPGSKSPRSIAPLAPGGVALALATLERCLEAARDDLLIAVNPARKVTAPKAIRRPPTIWSTEERAKLAPVVATDELEALWRLLLEAGLRIGEALGLAPADVVEDGEHPLVRVHRTVFKDGRIQEWPKSRRARDVLVTQATWASLQLRLMAERGCHWVFEAKPRRQGLTRGPAQPPAPMSYDMIRYRLQRLCARAGVTYYPTHAGRHSVATYLLASGLDPAVIAEDLGHADAGVTLRIYAHATREGRARSVAMRAGILPETVPKPEVSSEFPERLGTKMGTDEAAG